MNGKRKKQFRIKIVLLICILVFGMYAFVKVQNYNNEAKDEGMYETEISDLTCIETEEVSKEQSKELTLDDLKKEIAKEIPVDFRTLWKTNKDVYAWIRIAGTEIDYPVLHHLNGSPDYYLDHDWEGNEDRDGAIYSQWDYNQDIYQDFATFLYGHNWHNDLMFSTLSYYEEEEYINKHKEITIYTPVEVMDYQVIAVFAYSSISFPYYYDVTDSAAVGAMYRDMQKTCIGSGWFDKEYQIEETDHLLFLSTCNGHKNQRFLVGAVRKEDYGNNE